MARNELAYLPAFKGFYDLPLGRFLPPLPRGVISQWLDENTNSGDLILDPLGANPMSALEAARDSRRVLFARNNPVIWLLLEALASAPSEKQLRGLVNKLLLSRHLGETLDSHLQSVYETTCAECGNKIQPLGYIWEGTSQVPSAKVYNCPHCGDSGERPVSDQDFQNLERLGKIGMHRTRAFQRVMQGGDYEKESIEDALNCYLPRAIYVTMLLVNRLEGLVLEMAERRLLQAILVSVFDDASSLWHWPEKDHRHLQLSLPLRFIEKNLLNCLENATVSWKHEGAAVPVSYWPKLPPREGGICLYQRRLADQKELFEVQKPAALVSVFPRPNQAFWTLSALWSGWLWGRKGVTPMRSALSRRRYDWDWFAQAIRTSFFSLAPGLISDTQVFGLFPEITANFYLGLQTGMRCAGFEAKGAAYRMADDLIQCHWQLTPEILNANGLNLKPLISDFLNNRGEPATFMEIIIHCLTEISLSGNLPKSLNSMSESLFRQIQEEISTLLRDGQFIRSYSGNQSGGSQWWLSDTRLAQAPLSEQVEKFIRNILLKGEHVEIRDLEKQVCDEYPGSNTPPAELIQLCLESYADPVSKSVHHYLLQPEESLTNRETDLSEMRSILSIFAKKMDIEQENDSESVFWKTAKSEILYRYFFIDSCSIAKLILDNSSADEIEKVIIFPGSRSRLMAYRLKHDPRLEAAAEQNWHFVKFRTLRRLAQQDNLSLNLWKELLNSDPPLWDPPSQFQLL